MPRARDGSARIPSSTLALSAGAYSRSAMVSDLERMFCLRAG
jgi:hypothetical protein